MVMTPVNKSVKAAIENNKLVGPFKLDERPAWAGVYVLNNKSSGYAFFSYYDGRDWYSGAHTEKEAEDKFVVYIDRMTNWLWGNHKHLEWYGREKA